MIQSVQRAAQILDVLGSGTPRLGVTEIADRLGLAKPTVHGLLRTLEAHEPGRPGRGDRQVQPRPRRAPARQRLPGRLRAAGQVAARAGSLARQAGEAVWVATLSGEPVIVVHHVFRPDDTVQILEVGAAIPWHACALGHAIVASLPAVERAAALAADLAPLTGRTRTTPEALTPGARPGRARRGLRGGEPGGDRRRRGHRRRRSSAATAWWPARSAWSAPAERLLAAGTRDDLVRAVVTAGPGGLPRPGRRPRRRRPVRPERCRRMPPARESRAHDRQHGGR